MLFVDLREDSTFQNRQVVLYQYLLKCQQSVRARKCICISCLAQEPLKKGDSGIGLKKCQTSQFLSQITQIIQRFVWEYCQEQIIIYYSYAMSNVMKPLKQQIELWKSSNISYYFWIKDPKIQLDLVVDNDEKSFKELREQRLINVLYNIKDVFQRLQKTTKCPFKR